MLLGNLDFFFVCITVKLDDFQPVQKGWRNCLDGICRYNPENIRHIISKLNVVVAEMAVLFRIKDFKKG